MSTQAEPVRPTVRLLARELGIAVAALIGIGIVVAAAMVGLIMLLYAPR